MRKLALLLAALALTASVLSAQKRKVPATAERHLVKGAATVVRDTVYDPDSLTVAGFEKLLRDRRESMFIINSGSRHISALGMKIVYRDMKGRMLHTATHSVAVDLPAGETRRVEVPAFDRSGVWYYHLSPLPPRARRATPFKVAVTITYIVQ